MDNQHKMITGYRDLTQYEISLMNAIKTVGPTLEECVAEVLAHVADQRKQANDIPSFGAVERDRLDRAQPERWAAIARTHFQEGLMALVRAVAQPTTF